MAAPVAIITGAGRGIGRATAIALAGAGYSTVLTSRSEEELAETSRRCGGGLLAAADVTDPVAVQRVVERALGAFGRIDAVVHCAGLAVLGSIAQVSDAQWRAVLDTNLSAAFYLTRGVWPTFVKQKHGVVVYVSSESARDPFVGFGAYAAAKAGLNAMGLALAREGAPSGICVHTIAPGAVETDMLRALFSEAIVPAEHTLAPQDVAQVIAQCVRGELRYASGETIYLNKPARD